jgi:flagellar basal-body rod protein FlgF
MGMNMQPVYVLASGGSRAMEQLDIQSNNLANVNTTGFKKLLMTEMSQPAPKTALKGADLLTFPRFSASGVDLSQGSLKKTDDPLDMALSGEGFFQVKRGESVFLTRSGKMHLDMKGTLLDDHGAPFLATDGKPILLDKTKPFTVGKDGTIYQAGESVDGVSGAASEAVAKLGVKAYDSVTPDGEHYYTPSGNEIKVEPEVKQGFLEASNLNATEAMVSLIESQRRFEIYGNLIRALDQLEQKAHEIGRA